MNTRPIIVHSLEHARMAIAVATEIGCPVTLRSAPGAAQYLGAQVFRDMIEEAAKEQGASDVLAVFDCGDNPGLALGALRHGLKVVRVDVPSETIEKIADIAGQTGARVESAKRADTGNTPEALDLLDLKNPEAAIRAWLTGEQPGN